VRLLLSLMFVGSVGLSGCAPDPEQFVGGDAVSANVEVLPAEDAGPPRAPALWHTCGDPVCRGWTPHPGVPGCGAFVEGDACPTRALGRTCDPQNACNQLLECRRARDPGPCPISRAAFKHDIDYLEPAEGAAVANDLLQMKLARWQYNGEAPDSKAHLGFIIDDVPGSPAVAADGDHVDLYGYTSMTVAAVQAQQAQLQAQQAQIAALQAELAAIRAELHAAR